MDYPKAFFDINLRFAKKVAEVSDLPFENALLHYTNLYIRFRLGRDFDSTNSRWQEYLMGLSQTDDIGEWTYRFYVEQRAAAVLSSPSDWPFGCFSYAMMDNNRLRLHFHNGESADHSPLCRSRMSQRIAELTAMFTHLKGTLASSMTVIGGSWLYNLEAYCRLFPPAYIATAQVSGNDFAYLPLWGQFLDHQGRMKEALIQEFFERLSRQQNLEGIVHCFPFRVLYLESSVQKFYEFYGV